MGSVLVLLFFIIHRVNHDFAQISIRDEIDEYKKKLFQKQIHFWNASLLGVVSLYIFKNDIETNFISGIILWVSYLVLFWYVFEIWLNKKRNKSIWYVGENAKIDLLIRKISEKYKWDEEILLLAIKSITMFLCIGLYLLAKHYNL